jgi:hypothetical protein
VWPAIVGLVTMPATSDPSELIEAVQSDYANANAYLANGTLWTSHAEAWQAELWNSRVEFVGCACIAEFDRCPCGCERWCLTGWL